MPLYGELQIGELEPPAVEALATGNDAWSAAADILTFTHEIDTVRGFRTLPPALHPALPPYVQIVVRQIDDGPFGRFRSAEVNVRGRSTIHQVGFTVAAYADSSEAVAWLRARYGQPVSEATITFDKRYYGIECAIESPAGCVFRGRMQGLHFISPADVLFTHSMNLARLPDGRVRLVQVELEYQLERAERGTARIEAFDAAAIGEANLVLRNALPPTLVRARELGYCGVRYLVDPARPAMQGTERVSA